MPKDLAKLKTEAAELALKGKLDEALKIYQQVVKLDPKDSKTWVRIGDLYRKLGRKNQAIEIYAKAARSFALSGFLMQAISVNKMILELDPNHAETQKALAELYSQKESQEGSGGPSQILKMLKRKPAETSSSSAPPPTPTKSSLTPLSPALQVEEITAAPPPLKPTFDTIDLDEDADLDSLFDQIMNQEEVIITVEDESAPTDLSLKLPKIPLFSSLSQEEFLSVLEKIQLCRFDVGDRIIREGEPGDAFYIIARGAARVSKKDPRGKEVELSVIREGEFFGEFAFFSGSVRHATVTVSEEMEALKISRDDLEEILTRFPRIRIVLQEFYKERLVGTLLAISPLFQPLPTQARRDLLKKFQYLEVEPGTVLIRQGEEGSGLYVIVSGEIAVSVKSPRGLVEVARLKEGEFFGEISLLTDQPTTANCIAVKPTSLFYLPKESFQELVITYPPILEVMTTFADERMKVTRPLLQGGEALTRAGLV